MIFETTGAASPHTFNILKKIARTGKDDPSRRDGTKYSNNRRGTRSFLTHHLQRISHAIQYNDALTILRNIDVHKQRAVRAAPAAPLLSDWFQHEHVFDL